MRGALLITAIAVLAAPAAAPASGPPGYAPVAATALVDDGRTLVTADDLGAVRVWDVAAHVERSVRQFGGLDIGLSPDGRTVAVARVEGIELADVRSGKTLGWLHRTRTIGFTDAIAFSPDGRLVAAYVSDSNAVMVWNVRTRRRVGPTLHVPSASLTTLAFSSDGRTLAYSVAHVPRAATLALVDVRRGAPAGRAFTVGDGGVTQIVFSPDGRTIATASLDHGDSTLRFWDVRTRRRLGEPLRGSFHAAYAPDGRTLVTQDGGSIGVRDAVSHSPIGAALPVDANVFAFSRDGSTLAAGGADGIVRLLDVPTRAQRGLYPDPYDDVAFSPDGRTIAATEYGGAVRLWDAATRTEIALPLAVSPTGPLGLSTIAFSPDGQALATGGPNVRLWSLATHRPLGDPVMQTDDGRARVVFDPAGGAVASVEYWYRQAPVRVWDLATGVGRAVPLEYEGDDFFYVVSAAFSPDGRTLAIAYNDESEVEGITLFDAATLEPMRRFGENGDYGVLAFSPDGRMLVSAGVDGATLWDAATGAELGGPFGGDVAAVAFSPDGRMLATGDNTGEIRFWDVATRTEVAPAIDDGDEVMSVAFSSDGRTLASAGFSGVRLWDVATRTAIGGPLSGR